MSKSKPVKRRVKEKKKRAPKPKGPGPDPKKTNAKLVHVNNAVNFLLQQHSDLEKRAQQNAQQVWDNQSSLKGGMDAAEFNLRAHQKVLNALAVEFEMLVRKLNDEVFKEEHDIMILEMADVTLGSEGGDQVVRRLDWPYYHREVEADLEELAKAEEERMKAEAEAAELEKNVSELTEATPELLESVDEATPEGATVFGG